MYNAYKAYQYILLYEKKILGTQPAGLPSLFLAMFGVVVINLAGKRELGDFETNSGVGGGGWVLFSFRIFSNI